MTHPDLVPVLNSLFLFNELQTVFRARWSSVKIAQSPGGEGGAGARLSHWNRIPERYWRPAVGAAFRRCWDNLTLTPSPEKDCFCCYVMEMTLFIFVHIPDISTYCLFIRLQVWTSLDRSSRLSHLTQSVQENSLIHVDSDSVSFCLWCQMVKSWSHFWSNAWKMNEIYSFQQLDTAVRWSIILIILYIIIIIILHPKLFHPCYNLANPLINGSAAFIRSSVFHCLYSTNSSK